MIYFRISICPNNVDVKRFYWILNLIIEFNRNNVDKTGVYELWSTSIIDKHSIVNVSDYSVACIEGDKSGNTDWILIVMNIHDDSAVAKTLLSRLEDIIKLTLLEYDEFGG